MKILPEITGGVYHYPLAVFGLEVDNMDLDEN